MLLPSFTSHGFVLQGSDNINVTWHFVLYHLVWKRQKIVKTFFTNFFHLFFQLRFEMVKVNSLRP